MLLDADDDCPLDEVKRLADRTAALNLDRPVAIAYANREYETWFLATLDSDSGTVLRQRLGISESERLHMEPEEMHAKSWLNNRMQRGQS